MALVGNIVVGISARTDELEAGLSRAKTSLDTLVPSVNTVKDSLAVLTTKVETLDSSLEHLHQTTAAALQGFATSGSPLAETRLGMEQLAHTLNIVTEAYKQLDQSRQHFRAATPVLASQMQAERAALLDASHRIEDTDARPGAPFLFARSLEERLHGVQTSAQSPVTASHQAEDTDKAVSVLSRTAQAVSSGLVTSLSAVGNGIRSVIGSLVDWGAATDSQGSVTQKLTEKQQSLTKSVEDQAQAEHANKLVVEDSLISYTSLLGVLGTLGIVFSARQIITDLREWFAAVGKVQEQYANLRLSLAATLGSTEAATQQFSQLFDVSQRLGIGTLDLAKQYGVLENATRSTSLAGRTTLELLQALAQANQNAGGSEERFGQAVSAVSAILKQAVVSLESLNNLEKLLPGTLSTVAVAMHTNVSGLEAMAKAGTLLTEVVLARYTEQVKRSLGDGTQAAVEQAGSSFTRFTNEWNALLDRMRLSGHGVLDTMVDFGTSLLQRFRVQSEALAEQVEATANRMRLATGGTGTTPGTSKGATATEQAELERLQLLRRDFIKPEAGSKDLLGWARYGMGGGLLSQEGRDQALHEIDMAQRKILDDVARRNKQPATPAPAAPSPAEEQAQRMLEAAHAAEVANKQLSEALDTATVSQNALNVSAKLTPDVFGSKASTVAQHLEFYTRQIAQLRQELEKITVIEARRPEEAGPEPVGLQARKAALVKDLLNAEAQKKAIEDAKAAADKAEREAEAEKKRLEAEAIQDAKNARDAVVRAGLTATQQDQQTMDQLRQLAAQYTTTSAARDVDTASKLRAKLAGSDLYDQATKEFEIIQASAKALEKYPALQQLAANSAEKNTAFQTAKADLDRYEELLNLSQGKHIEPAVREFARAQTKLAPVIAEGGPDAERAKIALQQLEPQFRKMKAVANDFAESFLSTIDRATQGGIKSFSAFTQSVLADLLRILQRQYLAPALGSLIEKGIGLATAAASAYFGGGGGGAAVTPGTSPGELEVGPFLAGGRASGGDMLPGRFYEVGEAGREIVQAGATGGHVYNEQQWAGMGRTNVMVNISTPDASSFQRSRGEIQSVIARSIQQAQRAA